MRILIEDVEMGIEDVPGRSVKVLERLRFEPSMDLKPLSLSCPKVVGF